MVRGLTILHAGEILGYCQLSFTYSSEADGMVVLVEELYIKPAFQNLGVAKQVFDLIEEEYKGKAKRIRLECRPNNGHAMHVYKKFGFETTCITPKAIKQIDGSYADKVLMTKFLEK